MDNPYVAAGRCLPIVMANQGGWLLLSAHRFSVHWAGLSGHKNSLVITWLKGEPPYPAESNFGGGIITFRPPYLFRTSPGYNLLVRGPANYPIAGVAPIEGLIETDWTASTFTMNWQMTNSDAYFEIGDPIAMLVPQKRSDLEQFDVGMQTLSDNPELESEYIAYRDSRSQWKEDANKGGTYANERGWQRHYYQGKTVLGVKAAEHQTRRHLKSFE
jgi:hypothetical protein